MKTQSPLFREQSEIIRMLRTWFFQRHFTEVSTPIRVLSPAMEEHLIAFECEGKFLHTSPEFAMKQIVSSGLHRIFQITHCFRKEEVGIHHSSEFRMLEWYTVGVSIDQFLNDVLELLRYLCLHLDIQFPKVHRIDATEVLPTNIPLEKWFFRWVDEIEPTFQDITVVYPYPSNQSALARVVNGKTQRFEIYWNGIELANAFDEECSSEILRKRWLQNNACRLQSGNKEYPLDELFLASVDKMPRCCGIAMGIDRLLMILLKRDSIQQLHLQ